MCPSSCVKAWWPCSVRSRTGRGHHALYSLNPSKVQHKLWINAAKVALLGRTGDKSGLFDGSSISSAGWEGLFRGLRSNCAGAFAEADPWPAWFLAAGAERDPVAVLKDAPACRPRGGAVALSGRHANIPA